VYVQSLLDKCVKPGADIAASMVQSSPAAGASTPVHKMFRVIEAGLGYQYISVWNLVLMVISQFFEVSCGIFAHFVTSLTGLLAFLTCCSYSVERVYGTMCLSSVCLLSATDVLWLKGKLYQNFFYE